MEEPVLDAASLSEINLKNSSGKSDSSFREWINRELICRTRGSS